MSTAATGMSATTATAVKAATAACGSAAVIASTTSRSPSAVIAAPPRQESRLRGSRHQLERLRLRHGSLPRR